MNEETSIDTINQNLPPVQPTKSIDLSRRLVEIIDHLLSTGDWDASLFLKKAKEHLLKLRNEADAIIAQYGDTVAQDTLSGKQPAGTIKVYISLYQVDGNNLQAWQNTVKTLTAYNVTRPTYRSEEHVRELISSKADIKRHAYVEILIQESDLIPIDPLPVDTLGHELLILKEGAVKIKNIISFVHANKKRYSMKDDILKYEGDITS